MDKDRWTGKQDGVHAHGAIVLSHKEGDIMPCPATRKDVGTIRVREVRQRKTRFI